MPLSPLLASADVDTTFKVLGELVEVVNRFDGLYAAFDTDLSEIETELNTESLLRLYDGVPNTFDSFRSNILGWITTMNSKIASVITDKQLILDKLSMGNVTSVQDVLAILIRDLNDNSESMAASAVTLGSITSELDNTDPGELKVNAVLDGFTAPDVNMRANAEYDGITSQLAKTSDTLRVTCIADLSTGQSAYNETFQILGNPSNNPYSHLARGSGNGPTIQPIHAETLLSGLQFTSFASNVPSGWTIETGAAGTEILEETTTVYEGSSSLELAGTGTDAVLNQSATGIFEPRKRYMVAAYVASDASVAGAGSQLEIRFTGTGYTAASSEKITLDASALNVLSGFELQTCYINMPVEIPSDFEFEIALENATAGVVHVDFMAVGAVTYFNGVNWAIVSGTDAYVVGDEFQIDITNDDAGVFQTYFRKAFGVQMPTSGSPTILDSWAT